MAIANTSSNADQKIHDIFSEGATLLPQFTTRRSKTNSQTLTLGSLRSAEKQAASAGFSQPLTSGLRSVP